MYAHASSTVARGGKLAGLTGRESGGDGIERGYSATLSRLYGTPMDRNQGVVQHPPVGPPGRRLAVGLGRFRRWARAARPLRASGGAVFVVAHWAARQPDPQSRDH